ncbi:MAG: ribosomal protein L7/L12 [Woeseiaceae bacterium]
MSAEINIGERELPAAVMRAIEQGRKIEAIKLLREPTGLGLAHAKVLVDRAARERAPQRQLPPFTEANTALPRLLRSLLLVVVLFAAYRYFVAP